MLQVQSRHNLATMLYGQQYVLSAISSLLFLLSAPWSRLKVSRT